MPPLSTLTQPGAEPHDLELTPRQVASLTTANLVIYEKGFQPDVDEAVGAEREPRGDRYHDSRLAAAADDEQ